jgi:RNA polymerase sigma-70 factor (ECF subfamily)
VDSAEFDGFYRATVRRLGQYAYAMCGDADVAQDLVHEAYLRAWQRWRRVAAYEHPEAWLRLVVTRLCVDRWRRAAHGTRVLTHLRSQATTPPPGDDTVVLVTALRRIPHRQRQAIVLHYLMDLSVDAVAAETGASPGTVKSWLARGRTSLAVALRETPMPTGKEHDGVR